MGVVIALLRAVNVGGRKVTAAPMRAVAEQLGYEQVASYVTSGNLVLVTTHGTARVERELGAALSEEFGFDVPVVARTVAQWDAVIDGLPFPDQARDDPSHLVVYAWDGAVGGTSFDPAPYGREQVVWHGSHAYAYYPDGIGRSKLTLPVLSKAAGRRGTARNWNTVLALARMAHDRG
ncbi:DUF1697 domain-containing protein [Cellulomonas edaphi]|uniref:DUF1697 domain-containing protein n=1 Tax=Cellulomonas edaphi TaxID=3053468 RepID=A0ABT7S874_9CELL|nr:DUF1697 domain-containing protein [Cellulomons edaphi]MDM7831815.1 DUF1697 domain-containing protein [Cellulomons edaphi]